MIRKLGLLCSVFVLVQHTVSAFQVSGVTDTWFHSRKFSSVWHFGKQKNGRGKTMQGQNMLPMDLTTDTIAITTTISGTWLAEVPVSPEPIHTAFTVATFLPQPFWLLMIALPNNPITKKIMGGLGTLCFVDRGMCCVVKWRMGLYYPTERVRNIFGLSAYTSTSQTFRRSSCVSTFANQFKFSIFYRYSFAMLLGTLLHCGYFNCPARSRSNGTAFRV